MEGAAPRELDPPPPPHPNPGLGGPVANNNAGAGGDLCAGRGRPGGRGAGMPGSGGRGERPGEQGCLGVGARKGPWGGGAETGESWGWSQTVGWRGSGGWRGRGGAATFGERHGGVVRVDGVQDALVADLRLGDEAYLAAQVRGARRAAHGDGRPALPARLRAVASLSALLPPSSSAASASVRLTTARGARAETSKQAAARGGGLAEKRGGGGAAAATSGASRRYAPPPHARFPLAGLSGLPLNMAALPA